MMEGFEPAVATTLFVTAIHLSLIVKESLFFREPWLLFPLTQCLIAIAFSGNPVLQVPSPGPMIFACTGVSLPIIGTVVASAIFLLDTKLGWLKRYHHTYFGGVLSHGINIPCWALMFNTPLGASALLVCGGWFAALGSALWLLMSTLNWGLKLPYHPQWVDSIYNLDMTKIVSRGELRGELGQMATSRTLFMFHPHGVLSGGWTCNGCYSREFNKLAGEEVPATGTPFGSQRTTGPVFLIDRLLCDVSSFFKLLCDASGRLEAASKKNIQRLMQAGRNICIIPGGLEEAALFKFATERVYLRRRKGIIKYALQHGYALTPVYTFGESRTFHTFTGLLRWRLWFTRSTGVPTCWFVGSPTWFSPAPIFPHYDAYLHTYVGAPLQLPKVEEPRTEDIDKWHAAYIAALQALFDAKKSEVGEPNAKLEIW
mmetsp:Transcript_33716/g.88671  ORF Transcript_33716/g.88671 Transcript_33716/m.88671 type:complete len:428 (+) Transcript_33716:56-1339(+)